MSKSPKKRKQRKKEPKIEEPNADIIYIDENEDYEIWSIHPTFIINDKIKIVINSFFNLIFKMKLLSKSKLKNDKFEEQDSLKDSIKLLI